MSDPEPSGERTQATPARPTARRFGWTALFAAIGAALAGAYAQFIGCKTGTCPITSSVWTASIYGGVVGLLVGWPPRPRS